MTRALRIGMNLLFLGEQPGGIGRVALELVRALGARSDVELELFAPRDAHSALPAVAREAGARVTRLPVLAARSRLRPAVEYGLLPAVALARGVDILHSVGQAGPVRVPRLPCVVTVHDVIWRRAGSEWGTEAERRSLDRVVGPVARNADLVVAVSEDAAADVSSELGVPRERIVVVPSGARVDPEAPAMSEAELRARHNLGNGPILLCVAQKRPYKNHEAVIRALATLGDPTVTLVLPGAPTPYEERLRALAGELGVAAQVRFPAWVADDELESLYSAATALVLPSRIEGFGLPVLEAMLRGVPVVCSRTTALGEVAGDAAVLVDPDDQAEIDAAVARVLADAELRERLAAAGRARAAGFTWEATAARTVAVYHRAIAART
jgi:glycosyltransferase involved in cell wall biosynthesis